MMGEPAVRLTLLFYFIHLLIWVKLVPDLCFNFRRWGFEKSWHKFE